MTRQNWEVVIGLEIHACLNTKSKLFSDAPNNFGAEPNTNIGVVCTGMPGSLPVLNKEAVRKAIQFGCAINGKVETFSKFDRKSYFYPDSPRNFQITQFDQPIINGGHVHIEVEGKELQILIERVHLEDDAGTLKHLKDFSVVDYNRAGAPLIEIVSKPCMHSGKQAAAYAMAIKAILQYIDASDCNMEEGSLRFDVNVSVRKKGEKELRTKVEIKNLNSFNYMEKAIESEVNRQIKEYERHAEKDPKEVITSATFRWDAEARETKLMRTKESADDYRYFPEPDLPPLLLTGVEIEKIRKSLPELPYQREKRYVQQMALAADQAFLLASDKKIADFFDEAMRECLNAKNLCNWILVEFIGRLKDTGKHFLETGLSPHSLATLVNLIEKGTITGKIAKVLADEMLQHPEKNVEEMVTSNPDYQPIQDQGELERIVDQVLEENKQSVIDFKNGKQRAFGFLVGQIMKLTQGKAPPNKVNQLITDKIKNIQ